jgi:hypothetical protein
LLSDNVRTRLRTNQAEAIKRDDQLLAEADAEQRNTPG